MTKEELRKQKKKEYYLRNREQILERDRQKRQIKFADPEYRKEYCERWRQYTRDNYEARLLASVKSKCKTQGIPFDLELADIVIPTHCPKTGIPLVVHKERGKYIDTPSIDRIDPNGGYVKGNVQIVSFWYNIAKLTWDEATFITMCKQVAKHHG